MAHLPAKDESAGIYARESESRFTAAGRAASGGLKIKGVDTKDTKKSHEGHEEER
jgi:hypothetical protein